MAWTALHQALGETSTQLTFALVEEAAAAQIQETAKLDWKAQLPLSTDRGDKQAQQYELAKDIAAMANSGGGLVVYGVSEKTIGGRTAAGELTENFAVTADDQKRIQQVAFSLVHPPVMGLELNEIRSQDNTKSVLAMFVPDSADAPHLIVDKRDGGFFQAPWRSGPETFFMTERELAAAYRRREQGRREQFQGLYDLHERFLTTLGTEHNSTIWTVAVAQPLRPLSNPRSMTSEIAEQAFVQASNAPWASHTSTALQEARKGHGTRRGLRHFYWSFKRNFKGHCIQVRVEVHGDGSLAVGITRDGFIHPDEIKRGHVRVDDIEKIGLDLLALLLTLRTAGGPNSDYDVIIDVAPNASIFRRPEEALSGHYTPYVDSDSFPVFRPVKGTVVAGLGRQELLNSAVDIIDDALNQVNSATKWTGELLDSQITSNRSAFFDIYD